MRSLIIKINLTFHYFELKSVRLVLDKFLVIINIVSAWFLFCLFFFHFNIVCQSAKVHLLLLKLIIWTWKHFYSCGACNHATHFSNNLIQNVFSHKNIVFFLIYIIELFTGWFSYLFWSSNILFFTILLQNSKQN